MIFFKLSIIMDSIIGVGKDFTSHHAHINPTELLMVDGAVNQNYAVLILNCPIQHPEKFLIPFWNKATVRVTVDGGTNRWLNYISQPSLKGGDILPIDVVTGDMDSITDSTMKIVKDNNTKIIYTPDQDETDFTKSLIELFKYCDEKSIKLDTVCVIYQSAGRIDQIMSIINTLYKFAKHSTPISLISNDSISWLLLPGKTTITIPEQLHNSINTWCSLIPFGEKCQAVTTRGLKWNLNNGTMVFGDLISTSNNFDGSETVEINTDTCLLWSMGLIPLFSKWYGISDIEI